MKKGKYLFSLLNGKKQSINYFDIDYRDIKQQILGFCSILYVVTDSYYKSNTITVYAFTSAELKQDEKLRSILFGRENSIGVIHLTQTQVNYLCENYTYNAKGEKRYIEMIPKSEIENALNKGIEIEWYFCDRYGYKHGTKKEDLTQKIDLHDLENHRIQIKCSITLPKSHGKCSKTNC